MATVYLLGPSAWASPSSDANATPMDLRRELAEILRGYGHRAILMEDVEGLPEEDLVAKFDRLLEASSDVVILWPPGARMSTTYTELVLLRKAAERGTLPRMWCLHHESVARIGEGRFEVLERGARSRYLTAVARLGIRPVLWVTVDELRERAHLLAGELQVS